VRSTESVRTLVKAVRWSAVLCLPIIIIIVIIIIIIIIIIPGEVKKVLLR